MDPEAYMIRIPQAFDVKCHEPLCNEHAHLYRYPDHDGEESTIAVLYCPEHAVQQGFCRSCGFYAGGLDSFEYGTTAGYCPTCADDVCIEHDYDDYYDDF